MRHAAAQITEELYPEKLAQDGTELPLKYRFAPGHPLDGLTVTVPLPLLPSESTHHFEVTRKRAPVRQSALDVVEPHDSATGEVSMLTGLALPVSPTVTVARATRSSINAFGYGLSQDGKNGHSAPFAWSG